MIAVDTSSWIAFFAGEEGADTQAVGLALDEKQVVLPPAVLSELLSDPVLPSEVSQLIQGIPQLAVLDGYWQRVGLLRAKVLSKGRKARLADALIAQSCLDSKVPLVTRDADFRHFSKQAGLRLLP